MLAFNLSILFAYLFIFFEAASDSATSFSKVPVFTLVYAI